LWWGSPDLELEGMRVDDPYNKISTLKTSGSRGVYNKFHAHFWYS
jgi:hypothetical protein